MDFKNILSQLSLLSEGTKETEKGRVHKADPGGYGRKYDTDEEGDEKKNEKKKEPEVKRGRGRPKKGSDDSGEVKKYDFSAFGVKHGKDIKLPKHDKEKTTKHSLKEWVEEIEQKYVAEMVPTGMKPLAMLDPQNKQVGAGVLTSPNPAIQKMLGGIDPKDVKIVQTTQPSAQPAAGSTGQAPVGTQPVKEKWAGDAKVHSTGEYSSKSVEELKSMLAKLKKTGPHPENSPEAKKQRQINFALRAKGGWKKGEGAAQKESVDEGDIPSDQVDMGAGLGAGRSQATFEAKAKPDYIDLDKDGNKKESMKKAAQDAKKKKKVDESMDNRLKAAHHRGKAHALAKESYNSKYDDMEEARMYHEGYKEGLDECYGQVPIRGQVVGEEIPATVPGMASQAEGLDEMDMYEMDKTEYMKHKAQATPGNTFKAFGQTMHDKDVLETSMFESWDKELSGLLTEYDTIQEGLTVSISKGQQGAPDSVSVTAQDAEADQLLQLVKSAGLGLFGDEQQVGQSSPMSLQPADNKEEDNIDVVGDHDGMMALIKKVTGGAGEPETVAIGGDDHDHGDYEDEEGHDHEHTDEATCNECGMEESKCGCESGKEMVDEVESEDQMTYEVAEDNPPDSGAQETEQEVQDTAQANQSAAETEEVDESEQLDEWANEAMQNGTDAAFEADIAFMTKVIAGGLNKEKSTGQTTVPVIPGQKDRMGYSAVNESIGDWKKLAGLK